MGLFACRNGSRRFINCPFARACLVNQTIYKMEDKKILQLILTVHLFWFICPSHSVSMDGVALSVFELAEFPYVTLSCIIDCEEKFRCCEAAAVTTTLNYIMK